MNKKYNIARVINIVICVLIAATIMYYAYIAWSMNGRYTFMSFLISLLIHGGMSFMIYLAINWVLEKIFKRNEEDWYE